VLKQGQPRDDRTGTGTLSIFGAQARFDLRPDGTGFSLLRTKKLHIKSIIYELLWFLRGDTNVRYLNEHGVTIRCAMARLARRKRSASGSNRQSHRANKIKSTESQAHSERMEIRLKSRDGAAAVSCAVPGLCAGWGIKLPAVSAQRRFISWRALQHRVVLAAYDDGRAGL